MESKSSTPEKQTPTAPTAPKNPYIEILEEIIHKRKGRRSSDNIIRYYFTLFCAKVWDNRYSRLFGYKIEDPEALKKYDGNQAIGGPLTIEEASKITQLDQMKRKLLDRVLDWLGGLNRMSSAIATDILSRNYDRNILFSCLAETKGNVDKTGAQVVYINTKDIDRLKPYLDRLDNIKASSIAELRACDVVAQVICKNYSVPSDAFRTLTPTYAKKLRGDNSTLFTDAYFYCRFSDRKDVNMLYRVMATGSFLLPNDYSIIKVLMASTEHDPKKIFELRQRLKSSEGLTFEKWLEECSGQNGVYALENPTIDDYFI